MTTEPARGQSWPFPTRCGPPMTENARKAAGLQIDADMVERACRAHCQASGADQAAIDAIQAKVDAATAQLSTDDAQDPGAATSGSGASSAT